MAAGSPGAQPAIVMFEAEAQRWEETGELQYCGSNEYGFTKLRCWLDSEGAKEDGVSDCLKRYFAAAEKHFLRFGPDWYDVFLRTKDWCSVCGESYRLENLSFCTHCDALLGYCHQSSGGRAANGNLKCPRCAEGEIVG